MQMETALRSRWPSGSQTDECRQAVAA